MALREALHAGAAPSSHCQALFRPINEENNILCLLKSCYSFKVPLTCPSSGRFSEQPQGLGLFLLSWDQAE